MEKIQLNCVNRYCGARIIGHCLDGIKCPICNEHVIPAPYDGLPGHINYSLFKKNNSPKRIKGLSIELSADTDDLVAKLSAIAKHAKALADELEGIDKESWSD